MPAEADPLGAAKAELLRAGNALQKMRTASTFIVFEDEWKTFLESLEKAWLKAELACKGIPAFQPWQEPFKKERDKEDLLRYLRQARHADQHTLQDQTKHIRQLYRATTPGTVRIDHLYGGNDGKVAEYKGSRSINVVDIPEHIELLRLKNRGVWYYPPYRWRGQWMKHRDPVTVAKIGLEFYRDFLQKAEEKFFKRSI